MEWASSGYQIGSLKCNHQGKSNMTIEMSGRRRLLAMVTGAVAALGLSRAVQASHAPTDGQHTAQQRAMHEALARQEIKELRHAYGIATDLIGSNTEAGIAEGRAIYHRIFTLKADMGAAGVAPSIGPDAWVEVVKTALAPYSATQHLIGTQYVTDLVLPGADGTGGKAHMSSYLQAWHSRANEDLWLFMGVYDEDLVWSPGAGWQINRMLLKQIAADFRKIQDRPAE